MWRSLLQLGFTLPLSLFVLLVHNWLLGRLLCFLLPMLQVLTYYTLSSCTALHRTCRATSSSCLYWRSVLRGRLHCTVLLC